MIWEFGSAITPSIVGGSAVAFFIVSLEGIGVARSTSIVLITALLDELFYIIIAPIAIFLVGVNAAFRNYNRFLYWIWFYVPTYINNSIGNFHISKLI